MKNKVWLVLAMTVGYLGISTGYSQNTSSDLDELVRIMTGSYNSEKQSKKDSTYYNISLHMYPIWTKSSDFWIYVEQALNNKQDQPYRQRVYKVEKVEKNKFKTIIFTLKDEQSFIGKWKTPNYFDQFDTSILKERSGCEVYLSKLDTYIYKGSTLEDQCKSSLRGASYATSKVEIDKKSIYSWDQGFDKQGKQVWGAEKGGYIFDKL